MNRMDLSAGTVRTIAQILRGLVMGVSLLVAAVLPRPRLEAHESGPSQRRLEVAIIASVFITSQLLFGPYTIFLYLCEWLVVVLTFAGSASTVRRAAELLAAGDGCGHPRDPGCPWAREPSGAGSVRRVYPLKHGLVADQSGGRMEMVARIQASRDR